MIAPLIPVLAEPSWSQGSRHETGGRDPRAGRLGVALVGPATRGSRTAQRLPFPRSTADSPDCNTSGNADGSALSHGPNGRAAGRP